MMLSLGPIVDFVNYRPAGSAAVLVAVMIHAEDGGQITPLEDVRVNHPAEEVGIERSVNGVALRFGGNRTLRPKHGMAVAPLEPAQIVALFRHAPVHVLVP